MFAMVSSMAPTGEATILHADLDAFYASVEQLLDPSLRSLPVAVGGGVVLAASYEAKRFGVRSGMPGWRARRLCPGLRVVQGHFTEYQRLGDQVIGVFRDFTPVVERVSIDEAFIDVAGSTHLFGSPATIGTAIRARVRDEVGLAVSVGVARTKHLAKVASQVAKPDGLVVVDPRHERAFLDPLPVELLWGVGPATWSRLAAVGIRTIGDLVATPAPVLEQRLGVAVGHKLASLADNVDERPVATAPPAKSVGAQAALGRRAPTPELVRGTLSYLVDRVSRRLRATGRSARTLTVRVRFADLRSVTRSATLPEAASTTLTFVELATGLVDRALADHPGERTITLLGVSLSGLMDQRGLQLAMVVDLDERPCRPGSPTGAARWSTDRAMDAVRDRFGRQAVAYGAVAFSGADLVPEAFRELAQRDGGNQNQVTDGSPGPGAP